MQIGLHDLILEDQPQDIMSLLGIPLFPRSLKSNKLCPGHRQSHNIGQWPWQCEIMWLLSFLKDIQVSHSKVALLFSDS